MKLTNTIELGHRTCPWYAIKSIVPLLVAVFLALGPRVFAQTCDSAGVGLRVLGSGGPQVNRVRASASYLIWLEGQARILVDAGGGAFLRFGQAGGRLEDLSLIAISHLHPDHVSDLPALLWLGDRTRKTPLPIVGPSGNDAVPGFPTFLSRLFDEKNGAFQVLGGTLRGAGSGPPLDVTVIDAARAESSIALDKPDMRVTALGVPHGSTPSLAYRIEAAGVSVVLGSDQTGTNPKFVEFAKNADVLVMHFTIGAGASSVLHAAPDVVGRVAHEAAAQRLVLSHIGLFDHEAAVAEVKKHYKGTIIVGADLQCTAVR